MLVRPIGRIYLSRLLAGETHFVSSHKAGSVGEQVIAWTNHESWERLGRPETSGRVVLCEGAGSPSKHATLRGISLLCRCGQTASRRFVRFCSTEPDLHARSTLVREHIAF